MALCPNQDWSWLESWPLTSSSPLTEGQRYWTRSSPGGNDRGAESVTTLRFVLWATVLSSCQRGTNILFSTAAPKVVLDYGIWKTQALSKMFASGSEAHFAAKGLVLGSRRAPLQTGGSVQRISACSQRRPARALRDRAGWEDQVRREHESTRNRCGPRRCAAQEGSKEANVRRGKSFAHAAR